MDTVVWIGNKNRKEDEKSEDNFELYNDCRQYLHGFQIYGQRESDVQKLGEQVNRIIPLLFSDHYSDYTDTLF